MQVIWVMLVLFSAGTDGGAAIHSEKFASQDLCMQALSAVQKNAEKENTYTGRRYIGNVSVTCFREQ
jgi:hypothetical protein